MSVPLGAGPAFRGGSALSKSRSQGFCHSASDLERSSVAEVVVSYKKLRLML